MSKQLPYILLADDDPDDLETFTNAYTRLNPSVFVETVNDGKELFDVLDGCDPDELPTLILLDFKMPLISGPEVLQRLASSMEYASIPKLVWSTSERPKDIEQCQKFGADHYFRKPATSREADELVRQIDKIFIARRQILKS